MNEEYYLQIREKYRASRGDYTELFGTILSVTDPLKPDRVWGYLEQCIIEKRLSWLDKYQTSLKRTNNPLTDGYRLFYEHYLGLTIPEDGKIVATAEGKLVTRWWNPCPTLEACQKFGLDTRVICRKVYHRPVQVLLSRIDPRLRFARNYAALRPHTPYCEEIITLEP